MKTSLLIFASALVAVVALAEPTAGLESVDSLRKLEDVPEEAQEVPADYESDEYRYYGGGGYWPEHHDDHRDDHRDHRRDRRDNRHDDRRGWNY